MLPDYIHIKSLSDSYQTLQKEITSLQKKHTILELSEKLNMNAEVLSLFLATAEALKNNGISFVVVRKGIDIDNFPENLNIVPTLQEAQDILEMEAIERDLGF